MRYCEGPITSCKIALIGEAPGSEEELTGRPFVGAAGHLLDQLLSNTGLLRAQCYITNVVKERPPGNDISKFINFTTRGARTTPDYDRYEKELCDELNSCSANVLVPLGRVSLYATTRLSEISKYRGSILRARECLNHRKVVPTLHPSAALRQYLWRWFIIHDLMKAAVEGEFPDLRLPQRNIQIRPSFHEMMDYVTSLHQERLIAVDIEVLREEVSHISLAKSPNDVMCLAMLEGVSETMNPEQEAQLWHEIARVLENERITKVGQNLIFDSTLLFMRYGIRVRPIEDTMIGMGVLYPDFPKGLDFICSIYTNEPYYKDDGKKWYKFGGDEDSFRRYNCLDSAVCLEAWHKINSDLTQSHNTMAYQRHRRLVEPLTFMAVNGVRLDTQGLRRESEATSVRIQELHDTLKTYGLEIKPGNKSISNDQVMFHFYIKNRLKPYTKDGRPTVDEDALKRLRKKGYEEAGLLLQLRHLMKIKGTYLDMRVDEDQRMRSSYNPVGTDQGRISSSKTIFDTGGNMQNLTSEFKRHMLADDGCLLFHIDKAQAENRVVAYVANEPKMIEAFETGVDLHSMTAGLIFGKPVSEVSNKPGSCSLGGGMHSERYWGKKANHGLNYDLGYKSFALYYDLSEFEANQIVEAYHRAYPAIRRWHARVRQQLAETRELVNCAPFLRRRRFRDRPGDKTDKVGFSYIPQSTVGELMNEWGVCFSYYELGPQEPITLLNTVHDSLDFELPFTMGFERMAMVCRCILTSLEQDLAYEGRRFKIPSDLHVGLNFGDYDPMKNPEGLREVNRCDCETAEKLAGKLSELYRERGTPVYVQEVGWTWSNLGLPPAQVCDARREA